MISTELSIESQSHTGNFLILLSDSSVEVSHLSNQFGRTDRIGQCSLLKFFKTFPLRFLLKSVIKHVNVNVCILKEIFSKIQ